jgi:hypothetical protein
LKAGARAQVTGAALLLLLALAFTLWRLLPLL